MNECSPCLTILDTDYKYIYHNTINQSILFYSNLAMNSDEYEEKYPEAAQVSRQTKWNYKKDCPPISLIGESNKLFKVSLI